MLLGGEYLVIVTTENFLGINSHSGFIVAFIIMYSVTSNCTSIISYDAGDMN
jgi:hypothetical protein